MRWALDLFCGGGGAAEGMMRAGYRVVGVDTDRRCGRPYPGEFIVADALNPPCSLDSFDLVWASPPCQRWSAATRSAGSTVAGSHPDHIAAVRELLRPHPRTVIENVPFAPIRADLVLTGPQVGLPRILRRRHFELSWLVLGPAPGGARAPIADQVTITTSLSSTPHYWRRKAQGLSGRVPLAEARETMGITVPMSCRQVGEAVPPPYAEYIASLA